MRAMFMVVASVLLAVGLFGCNRAAQAPVAAPVVAIAPPAAIPPPPPAPTPVVETLRHHRHRAWHAQSASYQSYGDEDSSYSESEGDSDSAYVPSAENDSDAYAQSAAPPDEPAWVDGYGRSHYGSAGAAPDIAEASPDDDHARRSPWHGWNSDCDRR